MQTETEKIVPASWEPAWSHNFFSGPQNQPPAHTQVDIQRLPNTIRSTTTWEQQKPTSCEHRGRRGTCAKYRGTQFTCHATRSKLRNHSNKCGISKSSRYHATHCFHENAYPFQTRCFAFVRSRGNTHTLAERLINRPNSNLGDVNVDVGQGAPQGAAIPVVRVRPYDERNANVPV